MTDVPIAAYLLVALFDLISFFGRAQPWSREFFRAATFVLVAGAAVSVATALTGYLDWRTTERGTQVRRTVNAHAVVMITVTLLVLANLAYRWLSAWNAPASDGATLGLSLAAAALTVVGGMIGGSLVYDYGFNVENSTDHPVWHRSEIDVYPGGRVPQAERAEHATARRSR